MPLVHVEFASTNARAIKYLAMVNQASDFAHRYVSQQVARGEGSPVPHFMKIETLNDVLCITGIVELTASNAAQVREEARAALRENHKTIDIDLSRTTFLDSSGLGLLISLHKTMCTRQGQVRLLNPTDTANQVLELTRLHRLFEIVRS